MGDLTCFGSDLGVRLQFAYRMNPREEGREGSAQAYSSENPPTPRWRITPFGHSHEPDGILFYDSGLFPTGPLPGPREIQPSMIRAMNILLFSLVQTVMAPFSFRIFYSSTGASLPLLLAHNQFSCFWRFSSVHSSISFVFPSTFILPFASI